MPDRGIFPSKCAERYDSIALRLKNLSGKEKTMIKTKLLFGTAAACAAAAVFSLNVNAASAGIVSTQSSPLAVRSLASSSSSKLTVLDKGEPVTLISQNGDWWYVKYAENRYGYCHSDYITELTSANSAFVNISGGNLNVRSSASKASSVKDKLAKGEEVIELSSSNGWSRVLYDGTKTGYVYNDYLSYDNISSEGIAAQISLAVPDYKQYDSRWANMKIGYSGKTMRAIGCVTSALAATESYRTGDSSLTPAKMLSRLSYNSSGDVSWPSNYKNYTSSGYLEKTYELLKSGRPVIFGAKNAYGKMHWVVVTGYKGNGSHKASDFVINDPGSEGRKTLADLFAEYPRFYKLEYYI